MKKNAFLQDDELDHHDALLYFDQLSFCTKEKKNNQQKNNLNNFEGMKPYTFSIKQN